MSELRTEVIGFKKVKQSSDLFSNCRMRGNQRKIGINPRCFFMKISCSNMRNADVLTIYLSANLKTLQ